MATRKDSKGRVLQKGESQRADGTYMYRYTDHFKQRRTIYAKTLPELRTKVKEIAAREVMGYYTDSSNITLSELMQHHNNAKAERRLSTKRSYENRKKTIERFPIATVKASRIKTSQAKEWLVKLRKEEGFSVRSVYTIARYLKEAYKIAIEDEILLKNPFDFKLDLFSEELPSRKAITAEELASFLKFIKSHERYLTFYHYVVILSETGLRLGEFLGLTENDVDFEKKTLSVDHQLRINKNSTDFYIERPKTERGKRVLPLTSNALESIRYICSRARSQNLRPMVDGVTGFLVVREGGLLYSDCAFDKYLSVILKKYKEETHCNIKISPHVLRHTFCTTLIQNGVPLPTVQYLMGHSRSATTIDVYTHITAESASINAQYALGGTDNFNTIYTTNLTPKLTPMSV